MAYVFISYAHEDRVLADDICARLSAYGVTYFRDVKGIRTGDSISQSVRSALDECAELLVLLSPSSAKSSWVSYELGHADAFGKRIIPFLVHPGTEIPDILRGRKAISSVVEIDEYFGLARLTENAPDEFQLRYNKPYHIQAGCLLGFLSIVPGVFGLVIGASWEWSVIGSILAAPFLIVATFLIAAFVLNLVRAVVPQVIIGFSADGISIAPYLPRINWKDIEEIVFYHCESYKPETGQRDIDSQLHVAYRSEDGTIMTRIIALQGVNCHIVDIDHFILRFAPEKMRHSFTKTFEPRTKTLHPTGNRPGRSVLSVINVVRARLFPAG